MKETADNDLKIDIIEKFVKSSTDKLKIPENQLKYQYLNKQLDKLENTMPIYIADANKCLEVTLAKSKHACAIQ